MSIRSVIMFSVVVVLSLCVGCKQSAPPASSAEAAQTRENQVLAGAALVIDVRTPEETAAGHLDGALLIPVADLAARIGEVETAVGGDKTKKIVTYCKSGRRAEQARLILQEHGYTNAVNGGGYEQLK